MTHSLFIIGLLYSTGCFERQKYQDLSSNQRSHTAKNQPGECSDDANNDADADYERNDADCIERQDRTETLTMLLRRS